MHKRPCDGAAMIIKKYGNRRLYDTEHSRYITLEELTELIRGGEVVEIVDAKTGDDLTQPTLTQVIFEQRAGAAMLPVPLLHQMIRLGDDLLGEFFGRYLQGALELYLRARSGMQTMGAMNPFTMLSGWANGPYMNQPNYPPPPAPAPMPAADPEVARLRREMEELKKSLGKRKKR
jgi:polyhydroxyalkanoate synthesis repressor PhaR